jgi:XisI protein
MDRVDEYRQYIQQLLSEYATHPSLNPTLEREFVCDTLHDRYLIAIQCLNVNPPLRR